MSQASRSVRKPRQSPGFTLIEVTVTVAIIAILAAIGYPSYLESVARSRRAEARAQLAEAVQYMQRFYLANDRYDIDRAGNAVQLPAALSKSPKEGAARYSIQIDSATPISFKVKAVPVEADKC
jgi:type IV pilus assembly protein PilE